MNAFAFFNDGKVKRLCKWDIDYMNVPDIFSDTGLNRVIYFTLLDGDYAYCEFALRPSHAFYKFDADRWAWLEVDINRVEFYDLKPCPFCGAEPCMQVYQNAHNKGPSHIYRTICVNDGCVIYRNGSVNFDTPGEAIESWNTGFKEEEYENHKRRSN